MATVDFTEPLLVFFNNLHSSMSYSPFQILYGRSPPVIHPYQDLTTPVEAVEHILKQRDDLLHNQEIYPQSTQKRMKQVADKLNCQLQHW